MWVLFVVVCDLQSVFDAQHFFCKEKMALRQMCAVCTWVLSWCWKICLEVCVKCLQDWFQVFHCLFRTGLGLASGWIKDFVGIQGVYVFLIIANDNYSHMRLCCQSAFVQGCCILDEHRNNAEKKWKMQI